MRRGGGSAPPRQAARRPGSGEARGGHVGAARRLRDRATGEDADIAARGLGSVGLAFFPTVRPRGKEIGRMLLDRSL